MDFPTELRYSKDHEWCETEGEIAVVGITDYAQSELGDVVFIELPEIGESVSRGEKFSECESVKAVSDIIAPVSGEIIEVNIELEDSPELINNSPYEEGWIIKIKMDEETEIDDLMTDDEYKQYIDNIK